jgi:hypothetical protein
MSKWGTASTEGMKTGGYYDLHSEYQRRVIEGGDALIRSTVAALDPAAIHGALTIADYGAGTGATSVHAVRTAIVAARERDREVPILAVHNDVLTNDFSQLFHNVAGEGGYLDVPGGPVFPAAAAGSFFQQVVPSGTVHFGMCSNAAHWLREQPRVWTPDGMYFTDARGAARDELEEQAARDWLAFLESRAAELAPGGRLLVQGIGSTRSPDGGELVSASRMRVMWQVAVGLCGRGVLDRTTLDEYVFPVYCRSVEEALAPVHAGGVLADAFDVVSQGVDEVANPYWEAFERDGDAAAYAKTYTEFVRAFAESTMTAHLFEPGAVGIDPGALAAEFFDGLEAATAAAPEEGRNEAWIVRIVLARRNGDA